MEYQIRKLIREIGGLESEGPKQVFLRTVHKVLEEPPHVPNLSEEERILRARQDFIKKMKAMTAAPPFPLGILAQKERDLEERDRATLRLTEYEKKRPDPDYLIYQVTRSVNPQLLGHQRTKIIGDAVSLFASLRSRDALESMADRLLFGLHSTSLSSIELAAETHHLRARDTNIRAANMSAKTWLEIAKWREQRRDLARQKDKLEKHVGEVNKKHAGKVNGRNGLRNGFQAGRKNGKHDG